MSPFVYPLTVCCTPNSPILNQVLYRKIHQYFCLLLPITFSIFSWSEIRVVLVHIMWLFIEFSGFSYEETTGFCRGGGNWPGLSTAWYCLDEEGNPGTRRQMTEEECQSECDNNADCGAFDRALTDQSPCCLFTEGHTGNGGSGRVCFVKEDPITTKPSTPSMFHFCPCFIDSISNGPILKML